MTLCGRSRLPAPQLNRSAKKLKDRASARRSSGVLFSPGQPRASPPDGCSTANRELKLPLDHLVGGAPPLAVSVRNFARTAVLGDGRYRVGLSEGPANGGDNTPEGRNWKPADGLEASTPSLSAVRPATGGNPRQRVRLVSAVFDPHSPPIATVAPARYYLHSILIGANRWGEESFRRSRFASVSPVSRVRPIGQNRLDVTGREEYGCQPSMSYRFAGRSFSPDF